MKNPELRKTIIENGTLTNYIKTRQEWIANGHLELLRNIKPELYGLDQETAQECENARKSKKKQREKIENHIGWLLENQEELKIDLFFGTWTFTDQSLEMTADTRRQGIRRLLSKETEDFILNIDYGKENGREHYHGLIALKNGTYKITEKVWSTKYNCQLIHIDTLDNYKLGYYDLQEIKLNDLSAKKITRYITKLTQHSIKVKQSYISTKKGSAYQNYKREQKTYEKVYASNHEKLSKEYAEMMWKEYIYN